MIIFYSLVQHVINMREKKNVSIISEFITSGISVRKGKGNYRDTHIVTFAPRYLLDNRSTHKLAFAQREFARGKVRYSSDCHFSGLE